MPAPMTMAELEVVAGALNRANFDGDQGVIMKESVNALIAFAEYWSPDAYAGEDVETIVGDLLAFVMYASDWIGLDFDSCCEIARMHVVAWRRDPDGEITATGATPLSVEGPDSAWQGVGPQQVGQLRARNRPPSVITR